MNTRHTIHEIRSYFERALEAHGASPQGVDWNSQSAQDIRFDQLVKVINLEQSFTINDYGCGCGALVDYLDRRGATYTYTGYDISEKMIAAARQAYLQRAGCTFTCDEAQIPLADYTLLSGVFNIRLDVPDAEWTQHILDTLRRIDALSRKGFSFNLLTSYSDADRMRANLYYADPCFFFDYCKRNFSRNVALLHDYVLYDFTILVRKEA
jgi:SAM-dependent methyltransferase